MTSTGEVGEPSNAAPAANGSAPVIPDWVNEKNFLEVFKENVPGFVKIVKFEPSLIGGEGENYASIMLRIKATVEVQGNCTKDIAFVCKTVLQGDKSALMVKALGLFPKETAMYSQLLREFEQMYRDVGKEVAFGPKYYTIPTDPGEDYILLEDLSVRGFKNMNRLEGLDKEHTEAVLRKLAQMHAVSALRFETRGTYEERFMKGIFQEENRAMIEAMTKAIRAVYLEGISASEICAKYVKKVANLQTKLTDRFISIDNPAPEKFNVMNHGDLWANNIMFRHSDEGKLEELIFVDFQVSRYSSPAVDLFYFLLSSTSLDIKVSQFDYFVKYYYDHLVENLKLLSYPKEIISLRQLRIDMIEFNAYAYTTLSGVMAAALLDPTKEASMDNFFDEESNEYKMRIYKNLRYLKHMEVLLPWLDNLGLLD